MPTAVGRQAEFFFLTQTDFGQMRTCVILVNQPKGDPEIIFLPGVDVFFWPSRGQIGHKHEKVTCPWSTGPNWSAARHAYDDVPHWAAEIRNRWIRPSGPRSCHLPQIRNIRTKIGPF